MIQSRFLRLAVLNTHPIQYFAPFYRRLNSEPDIDVTVLYCSRQGLDCYADTGFGGVSVKWDVPLLDGYRSVFLRNYSRSPTIDGFLGALNPSVVSELRRLRPDALLVHGHTPATTLLAVAACRVLGIPVLMRGETTLLLARGGLKRMLRKPLLALLYSQVAAFLAIGTKNREFYLAQGIPAKKIFLVPYTVNNRFFQERTLDSAGREAFRRENGLRTDLPVILYASKMQRRKRVGDLVFACSRLHAAGIEAQLVLLGDGEERPALERQVAAAGLPHVLFAGFQNQSILPRWYSIADVFVLPSENEPWGLIVNEVMNAGVPVVTTTDVGAAYDLIVQGETGYVYAPGDTAALAAALGRVIRHPRHRERMREHVLARINNWSYEEAVCGVRAALASLDRGGAGAGSPTR